MKKLVIAVLCTIALPVYGFAEEIYVASSSAGGNTGADCSNAHSLSWFNTSGNWANPKSSGKIGPGDTVHLCGTFGSTATIQNSGSSGSPITILFENNAKFSAPAWSTFSGAALYASGKSYVTIDGGTNGTIEATNSGTTVSSQDSHGIVLNSGSDITVQNMTIQNLYVRTPGSTTDGNSYGTGVYAASINNVEIRNNVMNNMKYGVNINAGVNTAHAKVHDNTIDNVSTGIVCAPTSGTTTYDDVQLYNNDITGFATWAFHANHHNDGIHVWGVYNSTGAVTNLKIFNNKIHGNVGHYPEGRWSSGYVYLEYGVIDPLIFNNILTADLGDPVTTYPPGLGAVAIKAGASTAATHPRVFNNTIVGLTTGSQGGTGVYLDDNSSYSPEIRNNIFYNLFVGVYAKSTADVLTADYNLYYQLGYAALLSSTWYKALTDWQGLGHETRGVAADPKLDTDYNLTSSTSISVRQGGMNLSSYFTGDKKGRSRPAKMGWSLGAAQYKFPLSPTDATKQ